MRKLYISLLFFILSLPVGFGSEEFRFALFTDLHITTGNPLPSEDLVNAIQDVNEAEDLDFVIVSGDVTENGDKESLLAAKAMLDNLDIPYYITAGNHETKWSESGATDFARIFGDDKFEFTHKGVRFVGFTTGPVIKMGDGHIAPQDIGWVRSQLSRTGAEIPVFVVTHYPLQTGDVDNWYEMTDIIRKFNVQAVLGGHYHRNVLFNYDGIPGIINRSVLRDKRPAGGYSIFEIADSVRVFEKITGQPMHQWLALPYETREYDDPDPALRPSFEINKQNKNVHETWRLNTRVGIYSTPFVLDNTVYYGDDFGFMHAISLEDGAPKWKYKTESRIISSPAANEKRVLFGSTDGSVYCLDSRTGQMAWRLITEKAVMGSPLISGDTVFIGGSDGVFRAISISTGRMFWEFDNVPGYVETRPFVTEKKVFFGAWDTHMYALNRVDGKLAWKWNNGHPRVHFSPAAVLPVVAHGRVFFTAPDRYWTALDAETGEVVWRTNQHQVRETLGISEDQSMVFSRCMNDSVVALDAHADEPEVIWKKSAGYGYDHNPSMLTEQFGIIIFGTKNGLLHGIDAKTGNVLWRYKIGNSIINTVNIISNNECILTTTEGVVVRLRF